MSQPPYDPPAPQQPDEPTPSEGSTPSEEPTPSPAGAPQEPQGPPPPPPASPYSPPPQGPPPPAPTSPYSPASFGPSPEGSWQGAGVPPGPPQHERRYEGRVVAITAPITVVALIALVFGGGALSGGILFPIGLFAVPILLIVSIVLSIVTKDVRQRSIWLGILIGVGLALIIGGGLCIAIIASLGY